MKGITKKETEILKKWRYTFHTGPVLGEEIELDHLIVIVHNPSRKHDSGYPFLRIFGATKENILYDMGWHDHYLTDVGTNTDALNKNIWRVMPWNSTGLRWKMTNNGHWGATIQLYDNIWS